MAVPLKMNMIFSALSNIFIRCLSAVCESNLVHICLNMGGAYWMECIGSHTVKFRSPVYSKTKCVQGVILGMHYAAVFFHCDMGFSRLGNMAHLANLGY